MTKQREDRSFEVIVEIEPPTTPDMGVVREQIAVLQRGSDAFLVPDSHRGQATVSSIAVSHEVGYLGGRAIACLNARDRNLLGVRRDLLTAAAYGVRELLFVYGDRPSQGERSPMTVRRMLAEARESQIAGAPLEIGVTADAATDMASWKRDADFVFTQISFDVAELARWRERTEFAGRVYAGVVVLASEKMAHALRELIPGLELPDGVLARLFRAPDCGVQMAIEQIVALRDSGAADGVHLIPARRYRQTADALADLSM